MITQKLKLHAHLPHHTTILRKSCKSLTYTKTQQLVMFKKLKLVLSYYLQYFAIKKESTL